VPDWRRTGAQLAEGLDRRLGYRPDALESFLYAHPKNPDIVYATGTNFWRSTNGGASFSIMSGPHVDHHALPSIRRTPSSREQRCLRCGIQAKRHQPGADLVGKAE
jgi:hypothetical protein